MTNDHPPSPTSTPAPQDRAKSIVEHCIDNPVKVAVGVILLVLFGLLTVVPPWIMPSPIRVPVQLTPNLDQPVVSVSTSWPGASPEEVEREIIEPQEEQLKGLQNLTKMVSTAAEGGADIRLEFEVGNNQDVARQDVSDALRRVQYQIPQNEFDNPVVVSGSSMGGGEIAWMILRSDRPEVDVTRMRDFVDDNVKPLLERVRGVSEIKIYGGREREIQVEVDAPRMARAGITFADLRNALQGQNANISAGISSQGKREVVVRTVGQFTSLEDVRNTVVRVGAGGPIRVSDVAEVIDGFKRQGNFVRSSGVYVLALPAYRKTNSNVIEVMEGLRAAIARCNQDILKPRGLSLDLTQVYDETVYISSAIGLVKNNIIAAGVLTLLCILAFLRSIRGTLVVCTAIPVSIIATFIVIPLFNRNVNVVMLAGMAFAVGMVVDSAIVVLENIFRHREMGKDPRTAAIDGGKEVWGAVLGSSLTTMVVFLPIIFVIEEAGQLFTDIAIAVSGALAFSMVVSICVIPPLAARLLGRSRKAAPVAGLTGASAVPPYAERLGRWVSWINASTARRLVVVGMSMALSIGISYWIAPAASYLPSGNRNLIFGLLLTPPGYSIHEYKQIGRLIEDGSMTAATAKDRAPGIKRFWEAAEGSPEERKAKYDALMVDWMAYVEARKIPELESELAGLTAREKIRQKKREIESWRAPPPPIENFFYVSFAGTCFMGCTSADPDRVAPLVNVLTLHGSLVPDAFPVFFQTSIFGDLGSGNSIDVEIRGDSLEKVNAATQSLQLALMADYGYPQPNPANYDTGRLETRLMPDSVRAGDVGFLTTDVGLIVRAGGDGAIVGQYRDAGKSYDLALRIANTQDFEHSRSETRSIADLPVAVPNGQVVPLSSLCRVQEVLSPQQIQHIETQRAVQLTVRPPPGQPLDAVRRRIESIVDEMRSPAGFTMPAMFGGFQAHMDSSVIVRTAGNASKLRNAWDSLKWLLLLSVLITYLLMAGLFESFIHPFIIMTTVPLGVVGGFLGLAAVHEWTVRDIDAAIQEMDMLTILGFVILLGTVVNNGILIVHQALNYTREGMDAQAAIIESTRTRVRPILMTVLTTVVGLLPLVLHPGAGAELYRGLGAVVLGGLTLSTIITMVVVPAMFSLFVSFDQAVRRYWRQRGAGHGRLPASSMASAAAASHPMSSAQAEHGAA